MRFVGTVRGDLKQTAAAMLSWAECRLSKLIVVLSRGKCLRMCFVCVCAGWQWAKGAVRESRGRTNRTESPKEARMERAQIRRARRRVQRESERKHLIHQARPAPVWLRLFPPKHQVHPESRWTRQPFPRFWPPRTTRTSIIFFAPACDLRANGYGKMPRPRRWTVTAVRKRKVSVHLDVCPVLTCQWTYSLYFYLTFSRVLRHFYNDLWVCGLLFIWRNAGKLSRFLEWEWLDKLLKLKPLKSLHWDVLVVCNRIKWLNKRQCTISNWQTQYLFIYFPVNELSFSRWQITVRSLILMQQPAVHLIRRRSLLCLHWIWITSYESEWSDLNVHRGYKVISVYIKCRQLPCRL